MSEVTEKNPLFKPFLIPSKLYIGGKSLKDIETGGKKIYKLSSNENPLGASPKAMEAISAEVKNIGLYPDNRDGKLREALQHFYKDELKAEQFITGNAGSEVLEFIIRAFLERDTEYIVTNPMFKPYQMFSDKMGAKMVDIRLKAPNYELDVEGIIDAINEKTRLIFLTSPNNPTGTYIPKDKLDRLIDQLPDHVVLVLDEVYYLFADADDYTTALPYVQSGKQVIGLNSFSKSFGMAGMRLGYAYTTPKLAEYIQCLYKPFMINRLGLAGAIAALSDQEFLQQTVDLVKSGREYIYAEMDKLGVRYWRSQANFILFDPPMADKEFETAILKEGIMVRPATSFGAPGCVRVSIGTEAGNRAFVEGLKKVLEG
ncbi:MAG: histidinol-phosphate transaminase [Saprospiraceae bacterium]